ncbi:unnamed protein product [Prorocentrum cordatum]|uniref:JmjC domain-containing protein n=1 Tax=Prorocentrum cordatum TaxID=2364126 RepID=A0ABN9TBL0_9DINO|nr:unnamed protein product [Polarella glacialis]
MEWARAAAAGAGGLAQLGSLWHGQRCTCQVDLGEGFSVDRELLRLLEGQLQRFGPANLTLPEIPDVRSPRQGQRVLVSYDVAPRELLGHERLSRARAHEGSWVVATPEREIYLEDLQDGIESLVPLGPMGGLPSGWGRRPTHMFRGSSQGPLHQAESLRPQAEGAVLAEQGRRDLGLGAARPVHLPASAPPPLALEGDPATDEGEWRLSRGEARLGERMGAAELGAGCRRGDRGVAQEAASLTTTTAFDDWPISGPRTAEWLAREIARQELTPVRRHFWWRQLLGLGPSDWDVGEHESLSWLFECALTYDQLNFGSDSGHLDNDGLFMGEEGRHGRALVALALETWISQKLSEESAVLKERRRAMEGRFAQRGSAALTPSGCGGVAAGCGQLGQGPGPTTLCRHRPGAWSALRGCGSGYACDGVVAGEFATYQRGRLALPAVGNQAIDLVSCLPDHYQKLLEESGRVIRLPAACTQDVAAKANELDIAMDPILSRPSPTWSCQLVKSCGSARGTSNCYYQFLLPVDLRADFVLPAMPRRARPRRLRDLFPAGAELVHIQVRVAPMGWSWAVALVQAANVELLRSGPLGSRRWLCNRRCAPAVAGREPAALLCIDNFASLRAVKEAVQVDGDSMERQLRGRGLATHDVSGPQVDVDLLGFHFDGGKGAIHIAPKRFWRLVLSLDYILTHPLLTGAELERLIGHLTYVLLLRREMLSLLSASYIFISKCYARTWAPGVMAVDASLTGLGAVECAAAPAEVGRVGRVRERWRFKGRELLAESSRARSMREGAVGDSAFPDVPADLCKSSLWKTVASRRWRHKAPIQLLEGEALLWAMWRQVRRVAHRGCRLLFLSDSMCICCAVAKGTAAEPPAATALPWHRLLGSSVSGPELETVGPPTQPNYLRCPRGLCRWLGLVTLPDWSAPEAAKPLSAMLWARLALGRHLRVVLPRSSRALLGRGRKRPGPSRPSPPWLVLCGVLDILLLKGQGALACALSGFRWGALLLHPEELLVPIKSGKQGDSRLLGAPELLWRTPALSERMAQLGPRAPLWSFGYAQLRAEFEESLAALGLRGLGATLPGLRRGGVSPDRIAGRRSQGEVARRGRGQAGLWVIRCERHGRLALPVEKVPPVAQQQLRLSMQRLPGLSGLSSTRRSTEFAWAENESPSRTCGADIVDVLPSFYQVSLGVTGAITRLHEQIGGAHAWLTQIEGRRLFYLFSPSEARNTCTVECSSGRGQPGFARRVALVDVMSPSAKRHPGFADARAQMVILYMGHTLLVPAGWSWYSVALEPSVTLYHPFWNLENRAFFTDGFRQYVDVSGLPVHLMDRVQPSLDLIKDHVEGDDDSDLDV